MTATAKWPPYTRTQTDSIASRKCRSLAESPPCIGLPAAEIELIEAVIARHELGRVTDNYAAALRQLAASYRLAVVTNIWSRKGPWLDELRRAGILDLFAAVVVSSDGLHMKPSPALFRQALAAVAVPAKKIVVVGDSLRCDIGGAVAAGLDSVWINPSGAARPSGSPVPTFEVRSLLELVAAEPAAASDRGDAFVSVERHKGWGRSAR